VLEYTNIPERILLNGHITYIEGQTYDDVWEAYDELPPKVKKMLEDQHYSIYVVDLIGGDENIAGRVTYGAEIIEIKYDIHNVKLTMFHECGHVLDDGMTSIGLISSSDVFQEIFEEERYNLVVDYNYSYLTADSAEYFAGAFAEYMTNPERLKTNTPKTYYFIESCLK
jgi:hypothetical protein